MKNLLVLTLLGLGSLSYAQVATEFTNLYGDYLGQTPPNDTAVVFAPNIISTDYIEHSAPAFSPDGNEVFWSMNKGPETEKDKWTQYGKKMQRIGDRWTKPAYTEYYGGPVFSVDGDKLYFKSILPKNKSENPYYLQKDGDGWSEPKILDLTSRFPELKSAGVPSLTSDNTLYFAGDTTGKSRYDNISIYRAKLINGEYSKLELLPAQINKPNFWNYSPFIAPDDSYIIFSSNRNNKNDQGDLYISFHDTVTDTWSEPQNMGEQINTQKQERFPMVSPDGKYLFFTRFVKWKPPVYDADIYWVSSSIIDELRKKSIIEE